MSDAAPEPDRVEGAPHPRETGRLFGQPAAEAAFLAAFNAGRLHHGWLLTGPRGVGKATFAWRAARFLLATPEADGGLFAPRPPATLDVDAHHPVSRRMVALAEGRHFLMRRGTEERTGRLLTAISVDEVRRLKAFLQLSAPDGGRRTVIVDAAEDMTDAAANAILKLLEEPPPKVTLFLVSHRPARLPPTIRSRCREIRLPPLAPADLALALDQAGVAAADPTALAELAAGSVGEAVRLETAGGVERYREIVALFDRMPGLDRAAAIAMADGLSGREAEARFDLAMRLIEILLARAARTGAVGAPPPEAAPGEAALLARLAPDPPAGRAWAEAAQTALARCRAGRAVNLDAPALLLDMLLRLDALARQLARR
ncbi:MAG: DNA polymerase III subunit delta' [Gemmobacter sp.]